MHGFKAPSKMDDIVYSNVYLAVGTSGQRLFCDNQTVGIIAIVI
jgi:hypothetical protein